MIIGRAIYWIGGDSITGSQWELILSYFHSKEVGIANVFFFSLIYCKVLFLWKQPQLYFPLFSTNDCQNFFNHVFSNINYGYFFLNDRRDLYIFRLLNPQILSRNYFFSFSNTIYNTWIYFRFKENYMNNPEKSMNEKCWNKIKKAMGSILVFLRKTSSRRMN